MAHACQVSCERCKLKKDVHYTEKNEENFFDLIQIGMGKLQNELSVLSDDDYIMQWNRLFCTNSKNSPDTGKYIPAHIICYFIFSQKNSQVMRLIKEKLGDKSFETLLTSIKTNMIPTNMEDFELFSDL